MATNQLNTDELSNDEMIAKYKEQQAAERGFAFLKDPLFFTDSVFLKTAERVEALAMVMGLCLLVYTLAQRQLRQRLKSTKSGLKNQLGKLTDRPTLRWIFQCFHSVHLLIVNQVEQICNLTSEQLEILRFFPEASQQLLFVKIWLVLCFEKNTSPPKKYFYQNEEISIFKFGVQNVRIST